MALLVWTPMNESINLSNLNTLNLYLAALGSYFKAINGSMRVARSAQKSPPSEASASTAGTTLNVMMSVGLTPNNMSEIEPVRQRKRRGRR